MARLSVDPTFPARTSPIRFPDNEIRILEVCVVDVDFVLELRSKIRRCCTCDYHDASAYNAKRKTVL